MGRFLAWSDAFWAALARREAASIFFFLFHVALRVGPGAHAAGRLLSARLYQCLAPVNFGKSRYKLTSKPSRRLNN